MTETMSFVQIIAILFSIGIFVGVIELIRRNYLKERYSLIWLAASALLILFSVWRSLLDWAARIIGVYYPPSLLFLIAVGFLIILLIHFSIVISSLTEKNIHLTQEIGILKKTVDEMRKQESSVNADKQQ
jgi:hypothetical protein